MIRIWLKSPWEEYDPVQKLNNCVLAKHKTRYFRIVNIKQLVDCQDVLGRSRVLFSVQHPNIASIYDIYSYESRAFLVTEHLHICISEVELQNHDMREWEIATIFSEVGLARGYVSSDGHRCSKA